MNERRFLSIGDGKGGGGGGGGGGGEGGVVGEGAGPRGRWWGVREASKATARGIRRHLRRRGVFLLIRRIRVASANGVVRGPFPRPVYYYFFLGGGCCCCCCCCCWELFIRMDCSCIVFFCGEYSAAEIVLLLLLLLWGGGLNRNGQRIRPNQRQSKTKHNRRHGNAKNRRGKDENTARAVEFLQKVNRENGREIERERERDTCRERERERMRIELISRWGLQ